MKPATICIFARPPVPGRTKARLAAAIGSDSAAKLAAAMLADAVAAVRGLAKQREVRRVVPRLSINEDGALQLVLSVSEPFPFVGGPPQWRQPDGDLGARVEWTMRRALTQSACALAVGADTPGLSASMLDASLAVLDGHDSVLGAAEDGGFYLLGLKRCPEGVFSNIRWSHRQTLDDTVHRLRAAGLSVGFATPWFDLDTIADLDRARTLIEAGLINAPHLASVLKGQRPDVVAIPARLTSFRADREEVAE